MLYFNEINPIHFIKREVFDYKTTFPTVDNFHSLESFPGVYTRKFRQKWPVDTQIEFQIQVLSSDTVECKAVINGAFATVTGVDITPTGWNGPGDKILRYRYTPAATGQLWFKLTVEGVIYDSPQITVQTNVQECLYIRYSHRTNLLNCVFWKPANVQVFYGFIYLEAHMTQPEPSGEYSTYVDDRGELVKLRPTPRKAYILNIHDVPEYMVNKMHLIFSCSRIYINNIPYMNEDIIKAEPIGNLTNTYNVTVKMYHTDYQYSVDDDYMEIDVLGDEDGFMIGDDTLIK